MEEKKKHMRFSGQIIKQAIAEVESGLTRREVCQKYGMAAVTLNEWLVRFGSQEFQLNIKRPYYTSSQKKNIVKAILSGKMTVHEANVTYRVKGRDTVKRWMREYHKELDYLENNPVSNLNVQESSVEQALVAANLKVLALETMIDVAEEELKIKIRKKSGAKQSAK